MSAVLLSIKPAYCELIASGRKTIEVRKTHPKLDTPFKCYIYCTKPKYKAQKHSNEPYYWGPYSGKVIGEFVCDKFERLDVPFPAYSDQVNYEILNAACLTYGEAHVYAHHNSLYAWQISNLKMYDDNPKSLKDFYFPSERFCEKQLCGGCPYDQVPNEHGEYAIDCEWKRPLTRPPQSWCYIEELEAES